MPGENQRQEWATFLIPSWLDFFQSSADADLLILSLPPHHFFFPELKNSLEALNPLKKIHRKFWTSPAYFREHLLKPAPTLHMPLDKVGPVLCTDTIIRIFSHCGIAQVLSAARIALFVVPGHKINHFRAPDSARENHHSVCVKTGHILRRWLGWL